ncbi:uncharacterized protein PHACADRAFT_212686 [Phanerochaete carnosa HHB-10118-sp]|uniref:Uncharacterized protein n=1 Tax=Phanerochaete carnosa (strain HHB-10118-sp) TaxID=650164 RepID=K5VZ23_PHACS|nr:uncharacterized protein PHACADRAFT_212686 [Phanerochaete carnosa HHB-10118-sp]EKM52095.1 hypothetical protein PHACADRAFT_212686 [Phanerochaete carnosa HHB-10118-sp]
MNYFVVIAALAATCLAQSIDIGAPAANSTVSPGQSITVEVDKPDSLTGSTEVALVLSMASCPADGCTDPSYDPSGDLGQILYNGPYNPQFHPETDPGKPPYQNFSVEVPTTFTSGENIALIATHLDLVGVGLSPLLEVIFVPLTIV